MRWIWVPALLVGAACSEGVEGPVDPGPVDPGPGDGNISVRLETVVTGLSAPVFVTALPGDDRLFVVEQAGRILIVRNGQVQPTPFLDIRAQVRSGGEQGLLGMAFHPRYAENGFFYVNYTGPDWATRIERYRVSADRDRADAASAFRILTVAQPFTNHNGGHLEFGPDGMLYIGLGDGGGPSDPEGHGQNRGTLLGAMLRIDVNAGSPYGIPATNPFRTVAGARPEIWAYGLRNPWRFSLDGPGNRFYIADVGNTAREEVNAVPLDAAGVNYGWSIMEGSACFRAGCSNSGLTLPVVEYGHNEGCSITGGVVYRGSRIPGLVGHYLYSDFCGGWIRSFLVTGEGVTRHQRWGVTVPPRVVSFGRDGAGELYVVVLESERGGQLLRIVPAT